MSKKAVELKKREEIPVDKTWDLEVIFENDAAWEKEYQSLEKEMTSIEAYQGKLAESAQTLRKMFETQDELSQRLSKLYVYAHLRTDQDTTNSHYQAMNQRAEQLLTNASSKMSYITPEILEIKEEKLNEFMKADEKLAAYEKTLTEINRRRPHVLSEKEEALLAELSDVTDAPSQTFGMLNNADLKFPTIKDESGNLVELTHGRYHTFMESNNRDVRESAFKEMHNTYGSFKNTFAATLSNKVKTDNVYARVRNFDSARHAALHSNNIPETVYDNLVEAINDRLPVLHRYLALRKKVFAVEDLHMYDLYAPLIDDVKMKITYEEAQKEILKSLQPLGKDYLDVIEEAFENRWIDVEENIGKRSGAYSSGTYGTNPYILMNWQNNINNMYTLTHELGHSAHSYFTRKHQPYRTANYSIFVAEVASTTNEALLSDYLLENLTDERERLYVLNYFLEGFRGTVFRQTMFAEFEHEIHVRAQKGQALTAELFTEIYYNLNKKYFGEDIVIDEEIGMEWARIPHFYYNYYVYQYATGYSAATALANQILTEGDSAVKRYKDYLKAGSSDFPIEVLKQAGVDMTSKQPIIDALDVFEERLVEMENILLK